MTWRPNGPPLAEQDRLIDELLWRLRPEALDQVEIERVLSVHEKIICPATVRDTEHFDALVCTYYNGYWRGLYSDPSASFRSLARDHFGRHLQGYPVPPQPKPLFHFPRHGPSIIDIHAHAYTPQMMAAERNAISGKEHGMIGVVAIYQRHLLEAVVEFKISWELSQVIPWTGIGDRLWLVHRIYERFGPVIDAEPGSPFSSSAWWGQEEEFLHHFIGQLRALKRATRI